MALGKNIKIDKLIPTQTSKEEKSEQKPKKKKAVKKPKKNITKKVVTKKVEKVKVTKKIAVEEKLPSPEVLVKKKDVKKAETPTVEKKTPSAKEVESISSPDYIIEKSSQKTADEISEMIYEPHKRVVPVQKMSQQEMQERRRRKEKYDQDILNLQGRSIQLIVFRLGDDRYALEIDNVKEIVPSQPVSKLPHAPNYIKGVTNIRGHVMVIIDLEEKFELAESTENKIYTLVIKNDQFRVGILVDEVPTTLKVQGELIESSSGILSNTVLDETFIKGLIKQEKDMVILLDIVELIESNEVSEVAQAVEDSN